MTERIVSDRTFQVRQLMAFPPPAEEISVLGRTKETEEGSQTLFFGGPGRYYERIVNTSGEIWYQLTERST